MKKHRLPIGWPRRDPRHYRFPLPNAVWEYKLKPIEFVILAYLCCQHSHGGTNLSLEMIAKSIHVTAGIVKKYLVRLVDKGLITNEYIPTSPRADSKKFFTLPNEIFLLNLPPSAFMVYAYLLLTEDRRTHTCHPSYNTIAAETGMTKNTAMKRSILEEAGVSQKNMDVFFRLVNQFYQDPYPNIVESGFQKAFIPTFSYKDTDAFQHLEFQPDDSLSCRMAAFVLLRDIITFSNSAENKLELEEKDPKSRKILSDDFDLLNYDLLFSNLANQTIHSSDEMAAVLIEYWKTVGIAFPIVSEINIIMAYGSDGDLIQNFHTAVVIRGNEEKIWLLEKWNPIYPYQFSCFSGEKQLVDYMKLRISGMKYAAILLGNSCLWSKH